MADPAASRWASLGSAGTAPELQPRPFPEGLLGRVPAGRVQAGRIVHTHATKQQLGYRGRKIRRGICRGRSSSEGFKS